MILNHTPREISQVEFDWALNQLEARGLITRQGIDGFALTPAGTDFSAELRDSLSIENRIILMLFHFDMYKERDDE